MYRLVQSLPSVIFLAVIDKCKHVLVSQMIDCHSSPVEGFFHRRNFLLGSRALLGDA